MDGGEIFFGEANAVLEHLPGGRAKADRQFVNCNSFPTESRQHVTLNFAAPMMKCISLFFLLSIYLVSCGQKKTVDTTASVAALSNKVIPLVNHLDNQDSCLMALRYLDSATEINKDCFSCYQNKLMFLYALQQFDKAIVAINECIRLQPQAHDLYLTAGVLYEKTGDSSKAAQYFQQSLLLLKPVLDSMNTDHPDYELLMTNQALNRLLLGDSTAGNQLLQAVADRQETPEQKASVLSFANRSKKELVDKLTKMR